MAWIRLSDDYNDHPKIDSLSDGAFRLWHQGMGYCRKFQTDGLIPTKTLRGLKAYSQKRMRELMTAWSDGERPLWHEVEGFGVKVHDYLDWNPSREEEQAERSGSAARMRKYRAGHPDEMLRRNSAVTESVTGGVTNAFVPGRKGSGSSDQEKEREDISERAGRLREELYPAWYAKHRHGARLRLVASSLEFHDAVTLCETWDDARLEKLAVIVLTTDDEWISHTDRGFRIFAMKASWADGLLAAHEAKKAASA